MSTKDTFIPPAEFVPLAAGVNVAIWRAQSAIMLGSKYRYIADCLHLDAIPAEWMTEFTLSLTDAQRNDIPTSTEILSSQRNSFATPMILTNTVDNI